MALFEDPLVNALILVGSLVFLNKASNLTITNSVKVADMTGFGKTTVGFILVAFSTSLPELLVAVFAAVNPDNIGVAIGNVLGSNIVNICLILGVCFLLIVLRSPKYASILPSMAKEEMGSLHFGLFIASIIPLTLLYLGEASRFIGIVLLAIFVFYLYQLSKVRKVVEEVSLDNKRQKLQRCTFFAFLGAIGVVLASYFIVDSASFLAGYVGISRVIIGATIVAFGTSVPELATSINATRKGHLDMALGNIIGSCFINITCILGVSLIASPLNINMTAFSNVAMFSLITNLFLWYFLSSEKITWRESAVLLFIYFVFLIISFSGYKP
ncbi:sodium:calcium antiporter [Candidatus Bathyarchaeota archaeon]|nr:sodium:calcium antiporter [Candidatus Bathyarchaeota archaeon]